VYDPIFTVWGEQDSVVADAVAEDALPLVAVERFDVALEGVDGQAREHTGDAFLDRFGEVFKIVLGVRGELTGPAHV